MDPARFEALLNEHKDAVYRQMIRVCNHREDAEDALASAILAAYRASHTLQDDNAFRVWLATIGRRVCSKMRTHPSFGSVVGLLEGLDGPMDADAMDVQVLKGCVRDAIDHLAPIYRDVYLRCEIEEASVPEAAEALGISVAAAKSRLLRARDEMRELLDRSVCGS